jgi:malate synthase
MWRIAKTSILGVKLTAPGRYKTEAAARKRAEALNQKGGIYLYRPYLEGPSEAARSEAFAKALREERKRKRGY